MSDSLRFGKGLSKKDREEILRIRNVKKNAGETYSDVVMNKLDALTKRSREVELSNYDMAPYFHRLQMYFSDRAVIDRFMYDDPKKFLAAMSMSSRFGYLKALTSDTYYSTYDCSHVFDILRAFASRDIKCVRAFLSTFPPPFTEGHKSTLLLCNGLYSALAEKGSISDEEIKNELKSRKESKFFRAMFDCLLAILNNESEEAENAIKEMVKGNRRQDFHSQMEKIICVEAHAFYEIFEEVNTWPLAVKSLNSKLPWDSSLFELLNDVKKDEEMFIKLEKVNDVLNKWIMELPKKVNVKELISA